MKCLLNFVIFRIQGPPHHEYERIRKGRNSLPVDIGLAFPSKWLLGLMFEVMNIDMRVHGIMYSASYSVHVVRTAIQHEHTWSITIHVINTWLTLYRYKPHTPVSESAAHFTQHHSREQWRRGCASLPAQLPQESKHSPTQTSYLKLRRDNVTNKAKNFLSFVSTNRDLAEC